MKFRPLVLAVVLLASGGLFASVTKEETFSFELNEGGRVSVTNVNGSITVTGGRGDRVEVVAIKTADNQDYLDGIEIKISDSPDRIVIETDLPDSDSWWSRGNDNGRVNYQISVPADTNLDSIETVNGDVYISGVSGKVVAESVNGDLDINDLADDASVSTVNGEIDCVFTSMGDQQKAKAETVNGSVTITLPDSADVTVSADTLNGSINGRDFDLETDKGFVGSNLDGEIGGGSARLNIDTVNGSIRIRSD